jgi:FkbM family methyltransferase
MNFKKIGRRIIWLSKSSGYILLGLVLETKKHPWKYIFDYLTVPAEIRYSRTYQYINRYFYPERSDKNITLSCGAFLLLIPKELYDRESFMVGFLSVYYDIVYPTITRFPVPVIIQEGPYELGKVDLKNGDYVIDAGANIGVFSMHAAEKIGRTGKVYAFEPIKEAFTVIENSATLNKLSKTITPIPLALGKEISTVDFKFSIDKIGGSAPNATAGNFLTVDVTTIDDFIRTEKIKKINFIKMDIEGAECDALRGASKTIRDFKPRLAICTYHDPKHPQEIQDIILGIRSDYQYFHTSHKIYAW